MAAVVICVCSKDNRTIVPVPIRQMNEAANWVRSFFILCLFFPKFYFHLTLPGRDIVVQFSDVEYPDDELPSGNSNDDRDNRNASHQLDSFFLVGTIVGLIALAIVTTCIVGKCRWGLKPLKMKQQKVHRNLTENCVFPVLYYNQKKKQGKRSPIGSTRSVLTFSNPNYNGADGPPEPKVTIWKRLKYDKAQVRNWICFLVEHSETWMRQRCYKIYSVSWWSRTSINFNGSQKIQKWKMSTLNFR